MFWPDDEVVSCICVTGAAEAGWLPDWPSVTTSDAKSIAASITAVMSLLGDPLFLLPVCDGKNHARLLHLCETTRVIIKGVVNKRIRRVKQDKEPVKSKSFILTYAKTGQVLVLLTPSGYALLLLYSYEVVSNFEIAFITSIAVSVPAIEGVMKLRLGLKNNKRFDIS